MNAFARFLAIAATTAGAAGLVLLFGGGTQRVTMIPPPVAPPLQEPQASTPDAQEAGLASPSVISEAVETNAPTPPLLELSRNTPLWEQQLAVLSGSPPKRDAATSRAILATLPALPEEALAAAAERAVDALPDADYTAVALPVVTNPKTHNRAMSVLFADLMERPDAITLPALLQIARSPGHAFAPAAKDNLQLLLGADYGTDWARWETEVQQTLARAKR